MRNSKIKYILQFFLLTMALVSVGTLSRGQSELQFSPENFIGNRSNNYQHIINAKVSAKIRFTNFAYLDSDYQSRLNLYNIRNTFSYSVLKNWSSNLAFGLKNPGIYSTVAIQYSRNHKAIRYFIITGATYQDGFTSESFGSILYSPKVSNNLFGFLKATFSLNIDKRGITRGIQQFRFGIKNKELIYGFAGNFDQFNYNKKKLANYGFFVRTTF